MIGVHFHRFAFLLATFLLAGSHAAFYANFRPTKQLVRPFIASPDKSQRLLSLSTSTVDDCHNDGDSNTKLLQSRRSIFQKSLASVMIFTTITITATTSPAPALAKSLRDAPLENLLYTILRVREATQQETRLIRTEKFKDVQRANVKLAVRFMLKNYRLSDTLIAASTRLENAHQRLAANDVGNSIVQNLYTILEYFDASTIENLKVGSFDNMAGKEELVLKGLDATQQSLDEFLSYFPRDQVAQVLSRVEEENALNLQEFDPKLGDVFNLVAPSTTKRT